jgi:hypothetical protein
VKGGSTVIAFAKDPSGYMWELIQRPQTKEPLCQVGGRPQALPGGGSAKGCVGGGVNAAIDYTVPGGGGV